ncbi:uncharacterized protein LAESUDRAFT_119384 [Laetiporus sulphureus 93-53]|uniref:Uncharacterized protein n=1 Tax=Laetiporus sulphureus 93-53 TaxID=1314785 RepID=A0A165EJX8_9APHY|nr:uncharacterized protein LAESUDRAFT_119384 [Laetiporus sulphureus 93-53]KZT07208.1 hypothetical protein LAESUDRAFT_119384 [Laetiporus sulphureus 93-53]
MLYCVLILACDCSPVTRSQSRLCLRGAELASVHTPACPYFSLDYTNYRCHSGVLNLFGLFINRSIPPSPHLHAYLNGWLTRSPVLF